MEDQRLPHCCCSERMRLSSFGVQLLRSHSPRNPTSFESKGPRDCTTARDTASPCGPRCSPPLPPSWRTSACRVGADCPPPRSSAPSSARASALSSIAAGTARDCAPESAPRCLSIAARPARPPRGAAARPLRGTISWGSSCPFSFYTRTHCPHPHFAAVGNPVHLRHQGAMPRVFLRNDGHWL